uniref:Fermentation-respiration switch protein n=1 Tax=Pithovirus LCPAC404 TaxID=2506597 RepID=A0A481ZH21_9VIRU|nr:MAG: fermentation-respiration switch protein [Pithovirus LCPAC404]
MFRASNVEYEYDTPTDQHFIDESGECIDQGGIHIVRYHVDDDASVLLHCHGNNVNLSVRQYMIDLAKIFGLNLILFDYHGYGKSHGTTSVKHLRADALAAYRYTASIYDANKIIIYAESLGGFLGSWLASKYKCSKLIVVSGFSSIEDMMLCSGVSQFLVFPFAIILRISGDTLPTKTMLKNVKVPTLIVHSAEDTIISYRNALINFKNCGSKKKKLMKITGGHANPIFKPEQVRDLLKFLGVDLKLITDKKIDGVLDVLSKVDMNGC